MQQSSEDAARKIGSIYAMTLLAASRYRDLGGEGNDSTRYARVMKEIEDGIVDHKYVAKKR